MKPWLNAVALMIALLSLPEAVQATPRVRKVVLLRRPTPTVPRLRGAVVSHPPLPRGNSALARTVRVLSRPSGRATTSLARHRRTSRKARLPRRSPLNRFPAG